MEFTFDLTPPAASKSAPLFAAIDGRAASLGAGEVVFHDPAMQKSHVMTLQVLQALDLCREFQPMEAHVEKVCAGLPGMQGKQPAARRVLESLAARGLLISEDAYLARFERVQPRPQAEVAGVFVRACDRPKQLQSLLQSWGEHHQRFPQTLPLVVVDDSRNAESAQAHAQLLRHFSESSGLRTRLFDRARWNRIAEEIASASDHGDAMRSLLMRGPGGVRSGAGIGHNLIVLLAAGQRFALMDDDFHFPIRRHPEYSPGLSLDPRGNGTRTYADHAQAWAAGVELDADPIAHHFDLCGQNVGVLMGRHAGIALGRETLRGLAPSRLPHFKPELNVLMTGQGHRGQSGSAGVAWLMVLDEQARRGLCRNEAAYAALRGDPPVWSGSRRYQIDLARSYTPFAIDGSRILAPTTPSGRGEDGLFRALCRMAHGDCVQLEVPFSIGHRQESGRDRSELFSRPVNMDVNYCFTELARHVADDLYATSPAQRWAVYAARLEDIALGSDEVLINYLREFLVYKRSLLIEQLQRAAEAGADMPQAWREDVARLIQVNGKAVFERATPVYAGWNPDATAADCAAAFRAEARLICAGLRAWPQAWALAEQRNRQWLAAA